MESLNNSMEIQIVGTWENYILYYNFSETQMQRDGNGRQICFVFPEAAAGQIFEISQIKRKEKKYI